MAERTEERSLPWLRDNRSRSGGGSSLARAVSEAQEGANWGVVSARDTVGRRTKSYPCCCHLFRKRLVPKVCQKSHPSVLCSG